jgi:hypothetical protein
VYSRRPSRGRRCSVWTAAADACRYNAWRCRRKEEMVPGATSYARRGLQELVTTGGGGKWPPKATFEDSWPASLRPYHQIFSTAARFIPVLKASLDDKENRTLIDHFRKSLQVALQENVDLEAVRGAIDVDQEEMEASGWMGFFACVAYLRHAYRLVHV